MMMTMTFPSEYLSTLCFGLSLLLLALVGWRAHRGQRRDAARVERLEDVLTRMTRELLSANAQLARTDRTLQHVGDRQDTLECRAAGGQRIESAVRVARQGAASEAVLKDLGLSDAEASLLLRLHGQISAVQPVAATMPQSAVTNPESEAPVKPEALSAESEIQQLTATSQERNQAASLARLLANADAGPAAA